MAIAFVLSKVLLPALPPSPPQLPRLLLVCCCCLYALPLPLRLTLVALTSAPACLAKGVPHHPEAPPDFLALGPKLQSCESNAKPLPILCPFITTPASSIHHVNPPNSIANHREQH